MNRSIGTDFNDLTLEQKLSELDVRGELLLNMLCALTRLLAILDNSNRFVEEALQNRLLAGLLSAELISEEDEAILSQKIAEVAHARGIDSDSNRGDLDS